MKHMKITMLLLLMGAIQLLAQGPRHGHGADRGAMFIQKLDSIVKLTEDQKTKIAAIQSEYHDKFKEMREKDEQPDREKMMRLKDEKDQKIYAVLTPDQLTLWEAAKDEKKEQMKKMHSEMKAYREQNIAPTMKRVYGEFESHLSETEKATIATVKQQIREMKKGFYASNGDSSEHGMGMGEHHGGKSAGERKHGKGLSKTQRDEVHQFAQSSLQPILDAHKTTLDKLMTDLEPMQATWKAEMKAIKQKYVTAEKSDSAGKMHSKSEHRHEHKKGQKDDWDRIKFILHHDSE